eukprot:1486844-Pleurochrysis_carterae.AAC.2
MRVNCARGAESGTCAYAEPQQWKSSRGSRVLRRSRERAKRITLREAERLPAVSWQCAEKQHGAASRLHCTTPWGRACRSSPPASGGKASDRMRIGLRNSRSRRDGDDAEPIDFPSARLPTKSHFCQGRETPVSERPHNSRKDKALCVVKRHEHVR